MLCPRKCEARPLEVPALSLLSERMSRATRPAVREPDMALGGLSVWIFGREFPDTDDYWDGNWLNVRVRMKAPGALLEAEGAFLRVPELSAFNSDLRRLYETLWGSAVLDCLEPNLHLKLNALSLGHIEVRVSITPDPLSQKHEFEFGVDQSYLAPLLQSCEEILERYPLRGSPD